MTSDEVDIALDDMGALDIVYPELEMAAVRARMVHT